MFWTIKYITLFVAMVNDVFLPKCYLVLLDVINVNNLAALKTNLKNLQLQLRSEFEWNFSFSKGNCKRKQS